MTKLVYIAHQVGGDVERNKEEILRLCREIHKKGVIPFAPYLVSLLYLDDEKLEERNLGVEADAEHFKRRTMDEVWLCGPKISSGMENEIRLALKYNIPIICYNEELKPDLEKISYIFHSEKFK
jgi:hypothetical protein